MNSFFCVAVLSFVALTVAYPEDSAIREKRTVDLSNCQAHCKKITTDQLEAIMKKCTKSFTRAEVEELKKACDESTADNFKKFFTTHNVAENCRQAIADEKTSAAPAAGGK